MSVDDEASPYFNASINCSISIRVGEACFDAPALLDDEGRRDRQRPGVVVLIGGQSRPIVRMYSSISVPTQIARFSDIA
jgi:hypothetical protein